jgi:hypothetical protein
MGHINTGMHCRGSESVARWIGPAEPSGITCLHQESLINGDHYRALSIFIILQTMCAGSEPMPASVVEIFVFLPLRAAEAYPTRSGPLKRGSDIIRLFLLSIDCHVQLII